MKSLQDASARRANTAGAPGATDSLKLNPTSTRQLGLGLALGAALLLAACGGGQGEQALAKEAEAGAEISTSTGLRPAVSLAQLAQGGSAPGPASAADRSRLARGAQLNLDSLSAAEQQALAADEALTQESQTSEAQPGEKQAGAPEVTLSAHAAGQIAPKSAYLSGEVARKAAAVRIPAYRFYNGGTGAHFYTTSETERATVASTLSPPFSFDGPAFSVASDHSTGLASVHRFYNTRTGVHFYTISEAERANVANNTPQYTYEGVSYFASPVAGAGLTPLYRFYVHSRGFHFYTASATEKANIEATLGHIYTYEGIGYYVLDTGWADRARLPHTGITSSQCYQAGSNTLVACGGSGATALNPQQDGHRAGIAPMSYSAVPSIFGPYPITNCVRDVVTGLVWEGKTAAGERAGNLTYTNLGNNAATDASGYVAAVNAAELCGYTDWRLPTRQELLTLVDYGTTAGTPISTTWFPNTPSENYWSANGLSSDGSNAWKVTFLPVGRGSSTSPRSTSSALRLVRGDQAVGPRYSYSTLAYGSDGANNVVNDALTGLQWRRCEQGRVWSGSACTGIASNYTHENALDHARQQPGWRLPNIKELGSLVDLGQSEVARMDPVAFPNPEGSWAWSSSHYSFFESVVRVVHFGVGTVDSRGRDNAVAVRLVRISP